MKDRTGSVRNESILCITLCLCLFGLVSPGILEGQPNPTSTGDPLEQNAKAERDVTVRVAVDEVRIDAVVLNWRGHQITDLTADDFEIYQDGRKQDIVSCTYMDDSPPKPDRKIPRISTPAPSREDIRRTILFLVDDFSMSFENLHHTRMALKNFVEKQMQPGDLVGILQTSMGFGRLFSSDKKQLLAAIEKIQWGAPQTIPGCLTGG